MAMENPPGFTDDFPIHTSIWEFSSHVTDYQRIPEGTQLAEVFLARKGPWSPAALYLSKRQEGAKRAPGNGLRGCLEFGVLLDIYLINLIKDPQTKTSKKSAGKPLKTVTA